MFQDNIHGRVVGKTAILLVKSKMGSVQVNDEGWRRISKLFQDVIR